MNGSGPGHIAADGSAVEFYALLPPDVASASLVHEAIPEGASVLELGAGAGRVTRPLLELGHPVIAVDDSAEMLANITETETVRARIEELDLGRRFDAVLLMSFLISYGDRRALLDACRRHVDPDGCVIVQRETAQWFAAPVPREWEHDGIAFRLYDAVRHDSQRLTATIEHRIGDRVWTQTFDSRRVSDEELPSVLEASGLRFDRFLDDGRGWILARP